MDNFIEKAFSAFSNTLLVALMIPFAFAHWLLFNGDFGAGKAIIFVITAFLFGSFFFFN